MNTLPNLSAAHGFQWIYNLGSADFQFSVDSKMQEQVETAYSRLIDLLSQKKVYGIHTQFGNDVSVELGQGDWQSNQVELLDFLSVGVGPVLSDSVVRRALRLQAHKVAQGWSGVHPETFKALVRLGNGDKLPKVPCYGSLGASGDLIPMAHAVRPIFAEQGCLGPRDVLGLVNTNAIMSSLAVELLERTIGAAQHATEVTALVSVALGISDESFRAEGFAAVPRHPARQAAAARIVEARHNYLEQSGSQLQVAGAPVQARYSVRCAPQVIGNALELTSFAEQLVSAEALSVADNPLVLEGEIWHGGHFYTAGLASATDMLSDCVGRLGEMSDRQTFLLVTESESNGLPRNLQVAQKGHVKGIHQLCNSLAQRLRSLALPSRLLSTPAESNNQDVVPASMMALLNLQSALDTLDELNRAARFIAQRACLIRLGQDLPAALSLSGWSNYDR